MQVSELMTLDPVTVAPDENIAAAAEVMQTMNIRHLPVVDETGDLVGMLSDRDVRALLLPYLSEPDQAQRTAPMNATVATVMTSRPLSVDAESDASLAAELMIENRVGSIPVVDADGALVGIVSYVDLLRHYVRPDA